MLSAHDPLGVPRSQGIHYYIMTMTKYSNLIVAIVWEKKVRLMRKTKMESTHFTQQSSERNACKGMKEGPVQG